jgi:hypothetical protein
MVKEIRPQVMTILGHDELDLPIYRYLAKSTASLKVVEALFLIIFYLIISQ